MCPHCFASGTQILGDEVHIICLCLTTKVVLDRFSVKFQRLTRLLDLPSLPHFLLNRRDNTTSPREPPPPNSAKGPTEMDTRSHPPTYAVSSRMPSAHTSHFYNQLLLTCPLMMRTQHRQTIMTIFHSFSPPLASNLYPYHQPTPCSHSSTP